MVGNNYIRSSPTILGLSKCLDSRLYRSVRGRLFNKDEYRGIILLVYRASVG